MIHCEAALPQSGWRRQRQASVVLEEEIIMKRYRSFILALGVFLACNGVASAEILALLNYESKPDQPVRREGIAIMDIDPESRNFGKILMEIPLPSDLVAHHIFFNRDRSKAYVTALGKSLLHVVNLREFPYRLRAIDVPDCQMGKIWPCQRITALGTSPAWARTTSSWETRCSIGR